MLSMTFLFELDSKYFPFHKIIENPRVKVTYGIVENKVEVNGILFFPETLRIFGGNMGHLINEIEQACKDHAAPLLQEDKEFNKIV